MLQKIFACAKYTTFDLFLALEDCSQSRALQAGVTVSLTISVQVSRFHGYTSLSDAHTGSSLRRVNIYKCRSTGASDAESFHAALLAHAPSNLLKATTIEVSLCHAFATLNSFRIQMTEWQGYFAG